MHRVLRKQITEGDRESKVQAVNNQGISRENSAGAPRQTGSVRPSEKSSLQPLALNSCYSGFSASKHTIGLVGRCLAQKGAVIGDPRPPSPLYS